MKIDPNHPLAARAKPAVVRGFKAEVTIHDEAQGTLDVLPVSYPVRLELPYPPSVNKIYAPIVIKGRPRLMKTKDHAEYMGAVGNAVRVARVLDPLTDQLPFLGPVKVEIEIFRPLKSGDLDNRLKAILDGLNGEAWMDDDQVIELHARRSDDKENPRAIVTVTPL